MAKDILSELVLQMTVENATFKKELEKTTARQAALEQQTNKTGKAFFSFDKAMGVATKGAAAFTAAMAALTISQERQRDLENYARIAGTTTDTFLDFARAAKTVGIENEKLADISKDTLEKLGEFIATGGGGFKDFFENVAPLVNLTAKELQGLSGPDVLIAVKKAMDDANISMEEQSFYLESIASDTTNLIPLLEKEGELFEEVAIRSQTLADSFSRLADESGRALTVFADNSGFTSNFTGFFDYLSYSIRDLTTGQDSIGFLTLEIDRLQRKAEFQTALGLSTEASEKKIAELQRKIDDLKESAGLAVSKEKILEGVDFTLTDGQVSGDDIFQGVENPKVQKQLEDKAKASADAYVSSVQSRMELAVQEFKNPLDEIDLSIESMFDESQIDWTEYANPDGAKQVVDEIKQDFSGLSSYISSAIVANMQIVTSGVGQMAGEASGLYRFLFALQKAAAIPAMIVNTQEAYTKALAVDPTGVLAEAVRISGYTAVGIAAGQAIAGVFHGGGVVPGGDHESTYLLKGGEYVESRAERRQIDNMIENQQGEVNVNLHYNIQAMDSKGVKQILLENNKAVYSAVEQVMRQQGRRL